MGTSILKVILVIFCLYSTVLSKAIHTSDKLDFGDTGHHSSLVNSERKIPVKVARTVDAITSPSEKITVSCGPGGCNTTKNNSSVETEVIVHVKTNVNLDKNKDKVDVEDISDVPIVVGYKGATPDETPNEEQFRSYPSIATDRSDDFSRRDYTSFRPLFGDSTVYIGGRKEEGYGRHEYSSERPSVFGERRYQSSSTSSYRPYLNGYYGSTYTTTPTPLSYYRPTSSTSRIPNSYSEFSSPRSVEVNGISTPVPVPLNHLNRRNGYNTFRDNALELQVPYFEHTYNKHYFSEEPPPHTIYYSKTNSYNPVEFRDIPRNKWRPSFSGRPNKYAFSNEGNNFINPYTHNHNYPTTYSHTLHHRVHGDRECSCKDQRTDDESNPYSAASNNHQIAVTSKDPGSNIDDKLASLN